MSTKTVQRLNSQTIITINLKYMRTYTSWYKLESLDFISYDSDNYPPPNICFKICHFFSATHEEPKCYEISGIKMHVCIYSDGTISIDGLLFVFVCSLWHSLSWVYGLILFYCKYVLTTNCCKNGFSFFVFYILFCTCLYGGIYNFIIICPLLGM